MAKRMDLVDKKFGRLTVINYSHSKKYSRATVPYWLCKCDCGKQVVVAGNKLRSGHTSSCGCLQDESRRKYEDLTGKKFNKLKVVKVYGKNSYGDRTWLCQCDCGKTCIVQGKVLKSGGTKSCGCYKKEVHYKTHKKYNEYFIVGDVVYIKNINNCDCFVIDLEDLDKVKDYCWNVNKKGYVDTVVNNKHIRLHRFLMNTPNGMIVDHINRKPWDNRKSNLRNATLNINARNISLPKNNTSGVLGVSFHKNTNKYRAYVTVNGKTIHLGLYDNLDEAQKARKKGEIEYYGEEIVENY